MSLMTEDICWAQYLKAIIGFPSRIYRLVCGAKCGQLEIDNVGFLSFRAVGTTAIIFA